jgi:hypothetical protein
MARWRNYFSKILNVHGVSDVRQAVIHTVEPLVPEPSVLEVELAIEKLKSHKSPGLDQIPAEMIKAGGRTIRCVIHKLIISIWNKEELPEEWKESIIVPIYKKGNKRDCNKYRGISLLPSTYKILSNILFSRLIQYAEEIIESTNFGGELGNIIVQQHTPQHYNQVYTPSNTMNVVDTCVVVLVNILLFPANNIVWQHGFPH